MVLIIYNITQRRKEIGKANDKEHSPKLYCYQADEQKYCHKLETIMKWFAISSKYPNKRYKRS